ncbi:UNVERIFIED_CONTAM: hypothetical protein HHA_454290 [Hammondia hammondi]|eukprot:XP_008887719.1 hypothetical protein HHA_454290 [Hammondia hammondi]
MIVHCSYSCSDDSFKVHEPYSVILPAANIVLLSTPKGPNIIWTWRKSSRRCEENGRNLLGKQSLNKDFSAL